MPSDVDKRQLYVNLELLQCGCYAELPSHHPLSQGESVALEELRQMPCILISSREQQNAEQEYYQNILGFGGSYLFADTLEEGRLLVVSNRGFLPCLLYTSCIRRLSLSKPL